MASAALDKLWTQDLIDAPYLSFCTLKKETFQWLLYL
jgi:hypothetical protein